MIRSTWLFVGGMLMLVGCTSIQVEPLSASTSNSTACIKENPKVIVPRFLDIVRGAFDTRGFETLVYEQTAPNNCDLLVEYTARRSWDFTPYLSEAEIWVKDTSGKDQGYASYKLKAGGGLDPGKWDSAENKMEKVFAQLFSDLSS